MEYLVFSERCLFWERQPFNKVDPFIRLRGLGDEFEVADVSANCTAKPVSE